MFVSASVLLFAAGSPVGAADITPLSLATRPNVVNLGEMFYDWNRQQSRGSSDVKVADSTANCNTCCIQTQSNGKTDNVHDCGFD